MKAKWNELVRRRFISKILLLNEAALLVTLIFNHSVMMLTWLSLIIIVSILNIFTTFKLMKIKENNISNEDFLNLN